MEIRSAKKREVSYPKMKELSIEKVKKAIPNTWLKLGITSVLFNVLMQSKVLAVGNPNVEIQNNYIGGAVQPQLKVNWLVFGCNVVSVMSLLFAIISAVIIICKKIKSRKNNKIKIGKNLKIACIVSSIMTIMYIIIRLLF